MHKNYSDILEQGGVHEQTAVSVMTELRMD